MRLEHSLLVDVTRQNMERLNEAHCESRKQCIVWGVVVMLLVVWCIPEFNLKTMLLRLTQVKGLA